MRHWFGLSVLTTVLSTSGAFAQTVCSATPAPEYFNALTNGEGQRYPLEVGPVSWKLLGGSPQPVKGSDGMIHLAYVLMFTNSWNRPATVKSIEVVDPAKG